MLDFMLLGSFKIWMFCACMGDLIKGCPLCGLALATLTVVRKSRATEFLSRVGGGYNISKKGPPGCAS